MINQIISERQNHHGEYAENARLYWTIQQIIRSGKKYEDLTCEQRMALDMIIAKLVRILSGNPDFADHWVDIAGYAQLVVNSLRGEK